MEKLAWQSNAFWHFILTLFLQGTDFYGGALSDGRPQPKVIQINVDSYQPVKITPKQRLPPSVYKKNISWHLRMSD